MAGRSEGDVPSGAEPGAGTNRDAGLEGSAAFPDFAAAAGAVLAQLRRDVGFRHWAVTRVTGGSYAVLATGPDGYPVEVGAQLAWPLTLCHRVLAGQAPPIVPDVATVPGFRTDPLIRSWQVAAYLSVPLSTDGQSLLGTLCALDTEPQPREVADRLSVVRLSARLLSTVFAEQSRADLAVRRADRAEADALLDPLTGLLNRRGWELMLSREEQRCQRYGAVVSVLVVDLDDLKTVNDRHGHAAGDEMLGRTARVLRDAFRRTDVVARLGGDEFGVLAVETDDGAAASERDRLQGLLDAARVPASIGVATRRDRGGVTGAWTAADTEMYRAKNGKPHRIRRS